MMPAWAVASRQPPRGRGAGRPAEWRSGSTLAATAALLLLSALPAHARQVDYARAERMLTWTTTPLIDGEPLPPHMLAGSRLWYRVNRSDGPAFMLVDGATNLQRPVFDNARLAAAMALATDTSWVGNRLPFDNFDFDGAETRIIFRVRAREFRCDIALYICTAQDTSPALPASFVRSPDGRLEAFTHAYNLWVRPAGGGDSTQLTTDGVRYWAYGLTEPRAGAQARPGPRRPVLQWAPDSRRLVVQRTDERGVGQIMLYTVTRQRPQYYLFPYAQPGDSIIPRYDLHILDVSARTNVRVRSEPQSQQVNGLVGTAPDSSWVTVQWSRNADRLYYTHASRGPKRVQLRVADAGSGETRLLAQDSAGSFVELNLDNSETPNWRIMNDGRDIVWFSERDGWGHLYHLDAEGRVLNAITSGPWAVATILRTDAATGRIWFTARGREAGRDPYLRHLYVVNLDGSGLTLLTPEDGDHRVSFTTDGRYFVDTWSKVDVPPVSVLRSADGRLIRTLEKADITRLLATGWKAGEPFTVKARDGVTDLYGVLWKPSNFDPQKKYPIIDHIYPGPQIIAAPKRFFPSSDPGLIYATFGQVQALAELGFIVINVDAMGTPYRSKAFIDTWYGNMGDNGIPDHIAAIRQLAARHSFIDIDRVGIFGHSGGGFASTDAILRYPDFFDVAFSTSGNHDNRTYQYHWGEKYQGLLVRDTARRGDNYESQANWLMAQNLKGHLFLVHGDMDDNVLPSSTLRVVDALIRADKDFDLLILPDAAHSLSQEPYVLRRMWDHFVRYLRGEEPPAEYTIKGPPSQ
jgi:dipeptidyl aminopeptidase/acylaminoacyl peptidase